MTTSYKKLKSLGKASNKIFDLHSSEKDYLYFDTAKPELYVNGVVRLQQLYIRDSDVEDIINSTKTENKDKIRGEIICGNGIKSIDNDGNTTFEVKPNGDVTANYAHFEGSVFVNGEIEGSVIKGANIFAGDDYTEQDIIDAPAGTIKGATIDGSKIYATTIYGTSKEIKDNLALNSKVVYPKISGKSYKLMSGSSQKFGVALGNDEDQTVYLNLGHGTGATTKVNDDMVYGEDSLMIQKEADVAKIYIVGKDCSVELYENENINISTKNELHLSGSKVIINTHDIITELQTLRNKYNSLEEQIKELKNPSA